MKSANVQSAVHRAQLLAGPEFAAEVQKHAEAYELSLRRLAQAAATGNKRRVRSIQYRILNSFSAKLVSMVGVVNPTVPHPPETIRAMAETLDPYKDCGEKVTCWKVPKGSGQGWRPICAFGPKRQAVHSLIADLLTARFGEDQTNYLAKGKGAERASDWIVEEVEQKEHSIFVLGDIKDCYRSVRHEVLSELTGLPKEVVINGLLIPSVDLMCPIGGFPPGCNTFEPLVGAARQGLPQGSRVSALVVALLLGPALRQIASAERIVIYGDDFAISTHSMSEAIALKKAAVGILESHPAGPFRLKRCEIKHVNDGFSFLSYHHRLDVYDNKVRRRPAINSYLRYERKVSEIFANLTFRDARRKVARYRTRWMKSFRKWPWNPQSKTLLWLTTFEAMVKGLSKKETTEVT